MCQYLLSTNHTWVCEEKLTALNYTTIDTYLTLQLTEKQEIIKIEEYSSDSGDKGKQPLMKNNIHVKNVTNVSNNII